MFNIELLSDTFSLIMSSVLVVNVFTCVKILVKNFLIKKICDFSSF